MTLLNKSQTNRLLGYPVDTRLLIINADDFGMCNAVNEAIFRTLKEGVVRSTSLMVPCPWALHAMHFLGENPGIPFGVHLTAISDTVDYSWGPVTCREKVPSLVDQAGYFYNFKRMPEFLAQVKLDQLEVEFRAQIEVVLAAGLKPTHLDWHSLRIGGRADIFDILFRLAKDYGLALRVAGRSFSEKLQGQGLPANDHDFLDSYSLDPVNKSARFAQMLHELPAGLSEWAVHPGLDSTELLAIEPDGKHVRQTDFDFLMSQEAKDILKEEGIILLDYRALQAVWRGEFMESKKGGYSSIDEYIATFPEETQKILEELRGTIKAAAPDAEERISYQIPTFALKGNLVHFAAWKNHIGFYPASSGTQAFKDELSIYESAKGSVKFPIDKPLPLELISKIVKFRVAENLKKAEIKSRKRK